MMAMTVAACSERSENVSLDQVTTKESNNQIFAKGDPKAVVVSFTFTPGRQSKNCRGFGICELVAFGIGIINLPSIPEAPKADIIEESADKFVAIYELQQPNDLEDKTLYVDVDFTGTDENSQKYVIKKGDYQIDYSIGNFGGYEMDVVKL